MSQARTVLIPATFLPADFVTAVTAGSARRAQWLAQGVEALCALGNGGFLNKTGCKDARQSITTALNDLTKAMWNRHMDLVRAEREGPINDLYYTSIDSAPMLAAWLKRANPVALMTVSNHAELAFVTELAHLIRWFTPISQQLLTKDVLSRAGSGIDPAVKEARAEQRRAAIAARGTIYKTCPCCYREQAIDKGGRVVHHGYTRPGYGYQTASCYAFGYEPLEVSKLGVENVLSLLQSQLNGVHVAMKQLPKLKSLVIDNPKHRSWDKSCKQPRTITIDRSHPDWKQHLTAREARLNVERIALQRDIAERKAVILAWHEGMTGEEAHSVSNSVRREA